MYQNYLKIEYSENKGLCHLTATKNYVQGAIYARRDPHISINQSHSYTIYAHSGCISCAAYIIRPLLNSFLKQIL